jgi:hypothetical protein
MTIPLGILLGDPVSSSFPIWRIAKDESAFQIEPIGHHSPHARQGEAAFAASNSSIFVEDTFFYIWIGTGGTSGARIIRRINHDYDSFGFDTFPSMEVPIGQKTEGSGVFAISFRKNPVSHSHESDYLIGIAVGGDFKNPELAQRVAVSTNDGGKHWASARQQPHGYRSSVAHDATTKTWITVGPNGTDISRDDGRNWTALKPTAQDPPDADKNWNALSLPFVVGPKGRIGKLHPEALKP